MRPKFIVLVIVAIAFYILGSRAGRERYEQISGAVSSFWNDPTVKEARARAKKETNKAKKNARKQLKKKFG